MEGKSIVISLENYFIGEKSLESIEITPDKGEAVAFRCP